MCRNTLDPDPAPRKSDSPPHFTNLHPLFSLIYFHFVPRLPNSLYFHPRQPTPTLALNLHPLTPLLSNGQLSSPLTLKFRALHLYILSSMPDPLPRLVRRPRNSQIKHWFSYIVSRMLMQYSYLQSYRPWVT